MQQGQAYGIVVDGFNGEFGQYTLSLTSSSVRTHPCTNGQPVSLQCACSRPSLSAAPSCTMHDVRTGHLQHLPAPQHAWNTQHQPHPTAPMGSMPRSQPPSSCTCGIAGLHVQGSVAGAEPPNGFGEGSKQPQVAAGALSPSAAPVLTVPSQSPSQLPTLQGSVPPGGP